MPKAHHTLDSLAHTGTVNITLLTACRLAYKYRGRVPTKDEICRDFNTSRACAYRWIAAIKEARIREGIDNPHNQTP